MEGVPPQRRAAAKLEDEKCENCGKIIKGSAKANLVEGRVVCTPCWKKLTGYTSPTRPATGRQLDYLRKLDFRDVDGFTFDQASWTLDRAEQTRYFAFQVARQEWGRDLQGFDLRPLVHEVFGDSKMLEEIYETMQRRDELTFARSEALQAAQLKNMDSNGRFRGAGGRFTSYDPVSLRDCAPDLDRDSNYLKVRDGLLALFGERAIKPLRLWTWITRLFSAKN